MSIPFAGRAIVTGAVSGLGRAITRELANRNWEIATVDCKDKSDEAWVTLDREVITSGGRHLISSFDVRDGSSWHRLANRLQKEWATIDLFATG